MILTRRTAPGTPGAPLVPHPPREGDPPTNPTTRTRTGTGAPDERERAATRDVRRCVRLPRVPRDVRLGPDLTARGPGRGRGPRGAALPAQRFRPAGRTRICDRVHPL